MLAFSNVANVVEKLELVQLTGGDIELTVLSGAGARMHGLRVRGRELLRRPDDPAQHLHDPFFWGGYVMAPWCNRITPGPVEVGTRRVDLHDNFRDGSAIHGQVYVAPWSQVADTAFAIEREGAGWPWRYRVEIEYAVTGARLAVTLRLRNLSDDQMPGGIGIHPCFRCRSRHGSMPRSHTARTATPRTNLPR